MDSPPAQGAPSDAYAQGIANGQATVSLAGSILQFGQPLAQAFLRDRADRKVSIETKRRLKKYMGVWYDHLMDDDKLERRPVMKSAAFREWMLENDGAFKPVGICTATASWAVLLYALGIGPTTRVTYSSNGRKLTESVVSYTPIELKSQNLSTSFGGQPMFGAPSTGFLEIPGEIVCHIINLFCRDLWKYEHKKDSRERYMFTDFGCLTLTPPVSTTEGAALGFRQADIESVSRTRWPLLFPGFNPSARHSLVVNDLLDHGTRMVLYFQTLDPLYGTSHGALVWPDVESTLKSRLKALRENLDFVTSYGRGDTERAFPALLLTRHWLEGANRIARRTLTWGGTDKSFAEDVLDASNKEPIASACTAEARPLLEKSIVDTFDGTFVLQYEDMSGPSLSETYRFKPGTIDAERLKWESIDHTLASYADSSDTWKKQLYDAKVDVKDLMKRRKLLRYPIHCVRVFRELTCPGSTLWDSTLYLE
jgi:hypothetical protein